MDLALKLWMYSPTSEYLLNEDQTEIIEWRDQGTPKPTAAQLDQAESNLLAAIAEPITIVSDKLSIVGDGIDMATITVTYNLPYPDTIKILVDDSEVEITLVDGSETVELTSIIPNSVVTVESLPSYQNYPASASVNIEVT